ncbi:hypothetical protein SLA2020_325150 [Shorea laevis]
MPRHGRACVVVLGDIGRSPRMQYHALSLAYQASLEVDIVAYGGSEPNAAVQENGSIHIHTVKQWLKLLQNLPKMLYPFTLLLKPIFQFVMLLWFLCIKVPCPDVFIVQCQPALNYDKPFSEIECNSFMKLFDFRFVSAYCWFEKHYGKKANGLLCVTRAMQHELAQIWVIKTPDEDCGILLEAAVMYDRRVAPILNESDSTDQGVFWKEISDGKQLLYPRLSFIITGKGPEKEKHEEKIRCLNLKHVAFCTTWLSVEDYPFLLGKADSGVCLHTCSSGLELPMKVVDMFGCGLPVCAVSYSFIQEFDKVEKNGLLFSSSSELTNELLMLLKGFPNECNGLKSLRNGALVMSSSARWDTEWEEHAKPLISEVS